MNNFPVQQFRFTSGEELIAEILEWDEDEDFILIKNAMAIETNIFHGDNERMYMFRPWLLYIEHPEEIVVLNKNQVMGNVEPNELLKIQYYSAVRDMHEIAKERISEHNKKEAMKLKRTFEEIAKMKKQKELPIPENVINFPKKPTVH